MAENTVKISERVNPLYSENTNKWELYRNAAKGGDSFINTENLRTHRLEEGEDYDERLERAYFLNYCDTIPATYNSYIFKGDVKRKPDDKLAAFRNNVDGKGTHITDFIKKIGYLASVYGVVHVIVDVPETTKKNLTIADVKQNDMIPFCTIVLSTQLKDWSVDTKGNFNWVIIESDYSRDLDPTIEREEEKHYKVITREEWYVENEDGEAVKYEDETEGKGKNTLGLVPMLSLYHKNIEDDKIGESLLKDIVYVNMAIMNWCSCIDEQIERQTFSQLVVPDDGSMSDEDENSDPLYKISTASIWTFPADSTHPPSFISPEAENLSVVWKLIIDHIKEMFRMSGLQGGTSDLYTSSSGRQSQMSFMGVNSVLSEKAATYEKFENQLSRLVYLQLGEQASLEKYEDVRYPGSFDVVALEEEVDSVLKIMERNLSPTFNKTLMKEITRKAIPLALSETRETIEDEIDNGDGIVEPLGSKNEEQIEKDGDGNPLVSNLDKSFKTNKQATEEESSKRNQE